MLPKGWRCHPLYDALGRTLTTTAADGSQQAMAYDATGARLSASRCGGTTGQSGTTTDSYDALGRVLLEQRLDCALNVQTTVTYSVDANGNQTGETTRYAAGGQTTLGATYDPLDRLATRSDGTRLYSYDASGNPTGQLVRDGSATAVHVTATFDGGNRVARMSDAVGAGESQYWQGSYTYDGLGNRTQVVENGTTTTYQYDGENQLTTVKDGTGLVLASYAYDAHHNRTAMTTSSGTTTYTYDPVAGVELTSRTDPSGKQTTYAYDTSGNLTTASYDPTGADQVTRYAYDATGRLASISQPSGTTISFRYDGDGNRLSKTSTTSGGSTTAVNDVYQLGHVAYETDATGTVLASFSYDSEGVPTSVRVGSDPTTAPVYYYVYIGHGDTIALTDATGLVVASYSYDPWGVVTSDTEAFSNGWHNPYLYDGKDGARYDAETGLYWLAVRAYDPTLGRFLSRDPLGRAPLIGWSDQPYVYAGNNPLVNVDPTGQRFATAGAAQTRAAASYQRRVVRIYTRSHDPCANPQSSACRTIKEKAWVADQMTKRDNVLAGLRRTAGILLFAGTLIDGFVDLIGILGPSSASVKLEDAIDLAVLTGSAFQCLPLITGDPHQFDGAYKFLAVINALAAGARAVLAILHKLGFWAQATVDAAANAATAAASGWVGILKTIIQVIAGPIVNNLLTAGAHAILAAGDWTYSEWQQQETEDIGLWCSQHSGTCAPRSQYGF